MPPSTTNNPMNSDTLTPPYKSSFANLNEKLSRTNLSNFGKNIYESGSKFSNDTKTKLKDAKEYLDKNFKLSDKTKEKMFSYFINFMSKDEKKLYLYISENLENPLFDDKLLKKLLGLVEDENGFSIGGKYADFANLNNIEDKQRFIFSHIMKNKAETSITFLKVSFLVILVLASIINWDTEFMTKYPAKFFGETMFFSILGTISVLIISLLRMKSLSLVAYTVTFIFMVALTLLCQISGMYTYSFVKEKTPPSKQEPKSDSKISKISKNKIMEGFISTLMVFGGIVGLLYTFYLIAIISYKFDLPEYSSVNSTAYFQMEPLYLFIIETVLFALLNTINLIPIAVNREHPEDFFSHIGEVIKSESFKIGGLFMNFLGMCLLHIILHGVGMYEMIGL